MGRDATGKGFLLSRQTIKPPIIAPAANLGEKQKAFLNFKVKVIKRNAKGAEKTQRTQR
jgi:hypothetical protein